MKESIQPSLTLLRQSAYAISLVLLVLPLAATAGPSGYKGEFIPFPQVTLHFNNRDVGDLIRHGSDALVDFFYAAKYNEEWRLLNETVISDEERDLERLVVGHVSQDGRQFWLGRYHTPLGQWNHKFHHGVYLQTTIHRPGIIEWEDDGGVIPAHATGITVGGEHELSNRVINYEFGLGIGPGLGNKGKLIAYNLLDMGDGEHDLALTGKISSHIADDPFDDSGLFAGHITIPSQAANIREVQQTVLGAYTNYTVDKVLWRASAFYIDNSLKLTGADKKDESFSYFYVEPDYAFNSIWTYYGRWEKSLGAKHNLYIQQIPAFITERAMIGGRYQMQGSQALKLEFSALEQYGKRFTSVEAQWSAALP